MEDERRRGFLSIYKQLTKEKVDESLVLNVKVLVITYLIYHKKINYILFLLVLNINLLTPLPPLVQGKSGG
jgi:hypothetical protein